MTGAFIEPEDADFIYGSESEPEAFQVLSLDPGGTTGWSIIQVHPDAMTGDPEIPVMTNIEWWTAGEIEGSTLDQVDQLVKLINTWDSARLVTEKFVLRQSNAVLAPVEINHTLAWALRPRYFVEQQAAMAMSTVTDPRLKEWGFWMPGKPHARDALRHGITFLKRKKQLAVRSARSVSLPDR